MSPGRRIASVVVAAFAIGASEHAARAADPTKEACFNAYEEVQQLRKAGKLRAAEALLPQCTSKKCPALVTSDCTKWSQEIETQLPTAVFVARDGRGADLVDVDVSIDGETVLHRLDGKPLQIDPGARKVRFQWNGKTIDQAIVIAEGQKYRRIDAVFEDAASPQSEKSDARADAPAGAFSKIPTASLALAGVGAVALASFAVFGILGKGKESCAPKCTQDEVDTLRADYRISDISLVVSVVALGAAVAIWAIDRPRVVPTALRW